MATEGLNVGHGWPIEGLLIAQATPGLIEIGDTNGCSPYGGPGSRGREAGGLVVVGWDIRPQGVQGQLRVVGGHAGDLQKALTAMLETVSEAAQAA
ncbi:DUF6507 family protein, partial [Streptomyces sp. NPDC056081]|uniref:DUF6507 family protein n=1 Tax=Streptomyces sp. NPDC056081 TaxID=3345705 RepID=UPI0035E20A2C